MTDLIRDEIRTALHAVSLGEGVACDYHAHPKEVSPDDPVVFEPIKLVDHPQLQLDSGPSAGFSIPLGATTMPSRRSWRRHEVSRRQ